MNEGPPRMTDKTPAQIEAENVHTTTVDWDGITVTVPASPEFVDPDAMEAQENQKIMTAIRLIIGSDEYDRIRKAFREKHGRIAFAGDLNRLMELVVSDVWGFDALGNSKGS